MMNGEVGGNGRPFDVDDWEGFVEDKSGKMKRGMWRRKYSGKGRRSCR
jgi:hypothetical protein